jgi:hypothetical protein
MKVNELSNEQLIDDLIDGHILGHPLFRSTDELRKELLSRLEYGMNAKKAIHKICPWLSSSLNRGSCEKYKRACFNIFNLDR